MSVMMMGIQTYEHEAMESHSDFSLSVINDLRIEVVALKARNVEHDVL